MPLLGDLFGNLSIRYPARGLSLAELTTRLEQSGAAKPRDDINVALGLGTGGAPAGHGNVEVRYKGPDNVNFDISQTGWVGTPTSKSHVEERSTEAATS